MKKHQEADQLERMCLTNGTRAASNLYVHAMAPLVNIRAAKERLKDNYISAFDAIACAAAVVFIPFRSTT